MQCYRIPRPRIVYEVLNTEVISIDFNTGNYYALVHVAKQIWQMIEQSFFFDQIVRLLADHFHLELDTVRLDVAPFIEELLKEGLIEVSESENSCGSADSIFAAAVGWEYDVPKLQTYTDVQNLLLLDPIHEVTEGGWPEKLD